MVFIKGKHLMPLGIQAVHAGVKKKKKWKAGEHFIAGLIHCRQRLWSMQKSVVVVFGQTGTEGYKNPLLSQHNAASH